MAKKHIGVNTLSSDERVTLLAIIDETYGTELSREEFAEAMLDIFENISGFEAISPDEANQTVNQLWSIHYGKETTGND